MEFQFKDNYTFDDLVEIVRCLRLPDGCPWDKEQTHKSIRQDFIEETYEVVEAIDNDDAAGLREELGDVLLQVVFHAQIEREKGVFDINDVADEVCKKMIIRHPHVFGEVKADTTEKVLENWDAIKMQTKAQRTQSEVLDSIARSLPAVMRAQKMQKKAAKVGFDFSDAHEASLKVGEELSELLEAVDAGDEDAKAEEAGDLLFAAVNVVRLAGVNGEKALYDACEKFLARFGEVERLMTEQGRSFEECSISELDSFWDQAKESLK